MTPLGIIALFAAGLFVFGLGMFVLGTLHACRADYMQRREFPPRAKNTPRDGDTDHRATDPGVACLNSDGDAGDFSAPFHAPSIL
jgi:hypothetical protein